MQIFKLMLLQPLVLGRMRWMHSRRLVRVLVFSRRSLFVDFRPYKRLVAAARDDDSGDRRGGRNDYLSNRCASPIVVARPKPFD